MGKIDSSDGVSASSSETETSSSETKTEPETWPIETETTPSETETFKIWDRGRDLIFFLSKIILHKKT